MIANSIGRLVAFTDIRQGLLSGSPTLPIIRDTRQQPFVVVGSVPLFRALHNGQ